MRAISCPPPAPPRGETQDVLFDGALQIFQSGRGYRFSLDALLLADFATVKRRDRVVDLGTGNGVIALLLARRYGEITIAALEIQPALAERATRNVRVNQLMQQIRVIAGDVRAIEQLLPAASSDVVVCNPPYRPATAGRLSPDNEKRIARHEVSGGLSDFIDAAAFLLNNRGRAAVIYLADRAVELLATMRAARLEPKRMRFVHSFVGAKASLVLVEAIKTGRAGVDILPPLIVYRARKEYSEEVAGIIRGDRPSAKR